MALPGALLASSSPSSRARQLATAEWARARLGSRHGAWRLSVSLIATRVSSLAVLLVAPVVSAQIVIPGRRPATASTGAVAPIPAQPVPTRERRALGAMQGEVDALELLQERLQRLLERSRDDLAAIEVQQPPPIGERLLDTLRDRARAVWRHELFSVSESSLVDGRTITVEHGVTVGKAAGAALLFVVGWVVARRASPALIVAAVQRQQLTPQLARVLAPWVMALLLLAVLVVVLELAHIPLTAFAFLGGALVIGVGFGTQNIIKNLISGMIILFERKIRVGDVVTIDLTASRARSARSTCAPPPCAASTASRPSCRTRNCSADREAQASTLVMTCPTRPILRGPTKSTISAARSPA